MLAYCTEHSSKNYMPENMRDCPFISGSPKPSILLGYSFEAGASFLGRMRMRMRMCIGQKGLIFYMLGKLTLPAPSQNEPRVSNVAIRVMRTLIFYLENDTVSMDLDLIIYLLRIPDNTLCCEWLCITFLLTPNALKIFQARHNTREIIEYSTFLIKVYPYW